MRWYGVASWVMLAGGLVPAAWFAWSWGRRIRNPVSLAAFDAGGWVFALLVVYAYQAVVYVAYGVPVPTEAPLGVARILLGVLLDAVIIARAVAWWRLRADFRGRHQDRAGAPPKRH